MQTAPDDALLVFVIRGVRDGRPAGSAAADAHRSFVSSILRIFDVLPWVRRSAAVKAPA